MVPFAGWEMPVHYPTGIIAEHLHTRAQAGLFDVCHMGEFFLSGPGAVSDLSRLVTRRLDDLSVGRCRYGFLTREDGTIMDDLIAFRLAESECMVVVNAATRARDAEWIQERLSPATVWRDGSDGLAKIDLQGPAAPAVMERLIGAEAVGATRRFSFREVPIEGIKVLLSATGYTGEPGYELFYPAEDAVKLWDLLLGMDPVRPAGLGARDTLRLESGLPLYGHDLDDQTTPLEANFARFVDFKKDFIGREALQRQAREGPRRLLMGLLCDGRRSAREGFEIRAAGRPVGAVTSAGFAPSLKRAIGMGYVAREAAQIGREVVLRGGEVEIPATLMKLPVYRKPE